MVMDTGALRLSWAQIRAPEESQLRKVLVVMATTAVGVALLSCSAPRPSADHSPTTSPMVYEPSAPVVRAPLSPPVGYASPPPLTDSPTPLAANANSIHESAEAQTGAHDAWRASPRWAAVKGEGCIVVERDPQAGFAAQAETAKVRVESCSKEDVDDLTAAQIKELSGY
jgi:hypothetical protein